MKRSKRPILADEVASKTMSRLKKQEVITEGAAPGLEVRVVLSP